jgi:DNA-directed RNA polymerase specialized sigma24 family protein
MSQLTFNEVSVKHSKLFFYLLATAYKGYQLKSIPQTFPKYCRLLHQKIMSLNPTKKKQFILSKEDIEQQLRLIWWKAFNNFYQLKPKISFKSYLIRMSYFQLRDFFKKEYNIPPFIENYVNNIEQVLPFKLDLNFVCLGFQQEPWITLYPYERYILYLFFTKELSILEIGRRLNRDKHTIDKQLKSILNKLKQDITLESLVAA